MEFDLSIFMGDALLEARRAFSEGEVPVGAVMFDAGGRIISRAHNQAIRRNDPTAHAEVLALRAAGEAIGNYRLTEASLVVTIEPCIMCTGSALNARIRRIVFGAPDPKAGAVASLFRLASDVRLNHQIEIVSGIREDECVKLLKDFFLARRFGSRSGAARSNPEESGVH